MGKRSSVNYDDYYRKKMESAALYQDFICDLFSRELGIALSVYNSKVYQMEVGESRQGVEIKHNEMYSQTGNLWIEFAEKKRPRPGLYAPSGFRRHDNAWLFVTGTYNIVFVFPIQLLKLLEQSGRYRRRENRTKTSIGFLLPDADARRYASLILTPNKADIVEKFIGDLHAAGRALHAAVLQNPQQLLLFDDPPSDDNGGRKSI